MIVLLQAAAVLTVIFSFVTALDIPHRNIELFSHFRLQYFVASVLLMLLFAFMGSYLYAGVLAVTAVFNATYILPWYYSGVSVADGPLLKLMHANVLSSNTEYSRLIELVEFEKPDLFFLQEVTPQWVAGTRQLLEEYPYTHIEARDRHFGIAAFSKLPFDSVRNIDSPPLGHPTIVATITFNNESLTIISSHPTTPVGRFSYNARNKQLESFAEPVNRIAGNVVLLGDFNSSTWCAHFRKLEVSTGLKSVRRGFGILPSWPTYLPFAMIPIDHALVSDGISVSDVRTGMRIGSDHLPLVITLTL